LREGQRKGVVSWEWGLPFCNVFPLLIVNRYVEFHFNAYHSLYWEHCIFRKNASKKREITQIKCWIELSSLVNRSESTLSIKKNTSVLSYTKTISQISMYYAETRADNSGYTNHRVVVMGSPFDSEQVSSFISLPIIIFEKLHFLKKF